MSADNWAICPVCKTKAEEEKEKLTNEIVQGYGQLPPNDYLVLIEKSKLALELKATLREDYELGVDEFGTFEVTFTASCSKCKFSFKYKDIRKVF